MAFLYLAAVIAGGIMVNDKLNEVALIEEAEAFQPALTLQEGSSFEQQTLPLNLRRGSSRSSSRSLSGSSRSRSSSSGKDYGIATFFIGCFMIPFSLVFLWKNEKKMVTYAKLISAGRDECRDIDAEEPNDENNFQLVHMIGEAVNGESITD